MPGTTVVVLALERSPRMMVQRLLCVGVPTRLVKPRCEEKAPVSRTATNTQPTWNGPNDHRKPPFIYQPRTSDLRITRHAILASQTTTFETPLYREFLAFDCDARVPRAPRRSVPKQWGGHMIVI